MLRLVPTIVEPEAWFLAFHTTSAHRWIGWLACGRYKHVSAFAFVPSLRVWVLYDVRLTGTVVALLPDGDAALTRLAEHTWDADVLQMRRSSYNSNYILRPFYCVSAIRHLIGLRGYVARPDGLWRQCLTNGGIVVGTIGTAARHRSADRRADARVAP
jgi:hypothetical protein